MCGRFTLTTSSQTVQEVFPQFEIPELEPHYNIAPTQSVAVIRRARSEQDPSFAMVRWGLVPFWAEDPSVGSRMINARSESVADKPAFKHNFQKRRCLVLADGFFEWMETDGKKQPYYIRLKGGRPFAFAGLWDRWNKVEPALESCTVLTTDGNDLIQPLHDRMPVILHTKDVDTWLDHSLQNLADFEPLMQPFPSDLMESYPVNPVVNSVRNDDARCIERYENAAKQERQGWLF